MSGLEFLVALAIAVGLAGTIVPVLPGVLLIAGGLAVWAWQTGGTTAWTVFAVAAAVLVLGQVVKYLVPGRRLSAQGVPTRTLWAGGLLGIIGFFVVPVVGLFLGFALGVYLSELQRVGTEHAGRATWAALRAVGLSVAIELLAALLATGVWVVGLFLT